jgi:HEAT repeat protein
MFEAVLLPLLDDPDAELRKNVVDVLVGSIYSCIADDLPSPKMLEALLPMLVDPDNEIRKSAVRAIGRLYYWRGVVSPSVETLLPLLDDPDAEVRHEVIDALQGWNLRRTFLTD